MREKIKIIQNLSGLTQTELATKLGVTFASLNRWVNDKAKPRKKIEEKLNLLYLEYSGEKQIPETELAAKKLIIFKKQKNCLNPMETILDSPDIYEKFQLTLTYNSNRIEGSTLSENETEDILFNNITLPNKTLTEQLEAKNHQTAIKYLFQHLSENKSVDEKLILKLHEILMNSIRQDAGIYRNHPVRILGSNVPTSNYLKIPELMKSLSKKLSTNKEDIISHITYVHYNFEQIHPFSDGNGRIGRLLIHAMLLKKNFPPAVIKQETKRLYITYLNAAQLKNNPYLLENFLCDAVMEGYKILERK